MVFEPHPYFIIIIFFSKKVELGFEHFNSFLTQ